MEPTRRSANGFCQGRLRGGPDLFDAKPGHALAERGAVNAVAVAQEVARRRGVLRKCLDNLLGGPFGAGSGGHVPVDDPASVDRKHQEDIEHAEGRGRGLRGGFVRTWHKPGDCPLGNVDAKLEQLAVYAGRAPSKILGRHPANQVADLLGRWRATWPP